MSFAAFSLHVTLSINILLLNTGSVHTHVCFLPSSFGLPAAICPFPGSLLHFQPISASLMNRQLPYNTSPVQTCAANTNSSA